MAPWTLLLCALAQTYATDKLGPSLVDNQSALSTYPSSQSRHQISANRTWPNLHFTRPGRMEFTAIKQRTNNDTLRSSRSRRHASYDNVPQFMRDLYEKYAANAVLHPSFDIIRSFSPYDTEVNDKSTDDKKMWLFSFKLISLKTEKVKLAEFRLFLMPKRNPWSKGLGTLVAVYEMKRNRRTAEVKRKRLLATEKIDFPTGHWIKINVTRTARKAVRRKSQHLELAVIMRQSVEHKDIGKEKNILQLKDNTEYKDVYSDFSVDTENNSPVLVVFSNEAKKEKSVGVDLPAGHKLPNSRRTSLRMDNRTHNVTHGDATISRPMPQISVKPYNSSLLFTRQQHLAKTRNVRSTPHRRTSQRRRRSGCRRKSMYVTFQEINWHTQIIAPSGYQPLLDPPISDSVESHCHSAILEYLCNTKLPLQAYRCSGKCFFPLSDKLNPTKHAIIQTLLHTNNPERTKRPCCVPTLLDPIPVLYIDQHGVVTYKYNFEDMVVRKCGCR